MSRLFDAPKRRRWTGSKELVPVDRTTCPACGSELHEERVAQPALIRHGGFGATSETTRVSCSSCGWHLTTAVDDLNPRHEKAEPA